MFAYIKEAARKRALYLQTRNEIARMPRAMALDLAISPEDADAMAYAAVYGKA